MEIAKVIWTVAWISIVLSSKEKKPHNKKTVFDIEKLAIKLNKAVSEQKTLCSLFKKW